jgi:exodeoxyribonuclease-3
MKISSKLAREEPKFPNKILCWNVNGVRALIKKGGFGEIIAQNADMFCLQETKAHPEQLDAEYRLPAGYQSYFDHSKVKKGYSGVAIYTKISPEKMVDGICIDDFDEKSLDLEGRFMQLDFPAFTLINCYFPNGGGLPARLEYKLKFYKGFIRHMKKLLKQGRELVICGDFNVVHKEPDAARFKENQGNIGFLPEERASLDALVDAGLVDAFRHFYPDKKDAYTWWDMKSYARDRNIGWRIDTFFVSKGMLDHLKDIRIEDEIYGSDHCPVVLHFK